MKEIILSKKRMLIILSVLILIGVSLFLVIILNSNEYSNGRIESLELKEYVAEEIEHYGLDSDIVVAYVQEFMREYNNAKKSRQLLDVESTNITDFTKQVFSDRISEQLASSEEYRAHYRNLLSEFLELVVINAESILTELNYINMIEQIVRDDEAYHTYLENIRIKIDYLLEKYFK